MKSIICSLLIGILFSLPKPLLSQEGLKDLDQVYGLDQTLYNGKKYAYYPPPGSSGNQFLVSPAYFVGNVTINAKCYREVILNYDIFNQQLLLQYTDEKGMLNIMEVSKAWLKGFSLGSKNFELLSLKQEPAYYQVLGKGPLRILYFWRKNLNLNDAIGSSNFVFTAAIRDSYVLMNGQLKPFGTKKSMIRQFDQKQKPEIKNYLRKHKINVKKASDQEIEEMITFIGNIK